MNTDHEKYHKAVSLSDLEQKFEQDCAEGALHDAYKDILVDAFLSEIGRRAAISFVLEDCEEEDISNNESIKRVTRRAITFASEI